jgi:AcrR family transcriptional regulator
MAKIDLMRRAEIGREKRERTRAQIVEVGEMLLAERPLEALTVDLVVATAGMAKGTFYYHFNSIDELAAAVGAKLGKTFDDLLTPARLKLRDPVERLCFAFTQFIEKAIADAHWARLVVQSSQSTVDFGLGVRANIKADIAEAIAHDRLAVRDAELAVDIVIGIWLQITRGMLQRGPHPDLARETVNALLRALGATRSPQ